MTGHLQQGKSGRGQCITRFVDDAIMPAEKAGIMECDFLKFTVIEPQLALPNQIGNQLGVMKDLIVPPELSVLLADRRKAMRAAGDDAPAAGAGGVKRLDVGFGHCLEEWFVARAAR